MPGKREETKKRTFNLSETAINSLSNYVSMNYSAGDAYGAYSQTVDSAIMSFCVNSSGDIKYDSIASVNSSYITMKSSGGRK